MVLRPVLKPTGSVDLHWRPDEISVVRKLSYARVLVKGPQRV
jgi:hypothetical protein